MNKNPIAVLAWAVVIFVLLIGVEALVTEFLWNVITAPILDLGRISFRTALAALVTVSVSARLVVSALKIVGGVKA